MRGMMMMASMAVAFAASAQVEPNLLIMPGDDTLRCIVLEAPNKGEYSFWRLDKDEPERHTLPQGTRVVGPTHFGTELETLDFSFVLVDPQNRKAAELMRDLRAVVREQYDAGSADATLDKEETLYHFNAGSTFSNLCNGLTCNARPLISYEIEIMTRDGRARITYRHFDTHIGEGVIDGWYKTNMSNLNKRNAARWRAHQARTAEKWQKWLAEVGSKSDW